MANIITMLEEAVAAARKEADMFYGKGNFTAGTRLRGKMQEIKGIAQQIRDDVSEVKNRTK
jgi:hypothetical protein